MPDFLLFFMLLRLNLLALGTDHDYSTLNGLPALSGVTRLFNIIDTSSLKYSLPGTKFPCYSDKPLIMRGSAIIGQPVPVESDGPNLLAWTIFLFINYRWNLRATVYGGSTLVTKVV